MLDWEVVRRNACACACPLDIGAVWKEKDGSRLTTILFVLFLRSPSAISPSPYSSLSPPPSANHSKPNSYGFASGLPLRLSMLSCRRGGRAIVGRPLVLVFVLLDPIEGKPGVLGR
jgi:hypothetical protein